MRAWEEFLKEQEGELGRETVKKWLRSLMVKRYDACNLYLEANDSFQALWFEEHIREKTLKKFQNGNQKQIKIHLAICNKERPSKERLPKKEKSDTFQISFDKLDPHCTFDSFILTEENQLTFKILNEVANCGCEKLNPLYLYGPSGSGKTHLLMSLGYHFQKKKLKTLYVRAELFTDHVVSAIRAGEMPQFRQAYRNVDVLIVDDIQFFSRKGATQEEFFHTFNTLHLEGKQIILSAHCAPQELQLIESRLISRFEWGIVLNLKSLAEQDLKKILFAKAKAFNYHLPEKIYDFLIDTFKTSKSLIKAYEALMLRLHLDTYNTANHLSILAARTLLADLIAEEQKKVLTPMQVIQSIAEHFGIRSEDILSKSQSRECVLPRQIAMYICRDKLKMPFIKMGDVFSRDHSTVMASVKVIQNLLEQDNSDVCRDWHLIMKKLT